MVSPIKLTMLKRKAPGDENADPAAVEAEIIDELFVEEPAEDSAPLKSYQEQLESAIRTVFNGETDLFTDDEWTLLFTFMTLEGTLYSF